MEYEHEEPVIGKIFTSGHSQALRLPRSVRFSEDIREVEITRQGEELVLRPKKRKMTQKEWCARWNRFFSDSSRMGDDFMSERPFNRPLQDCDD